MANTVVPLIRQEAIEHASARRYGTVILARPVSFTILTILFSLAAVGIAAFLAGFSYTRKAQVVGVLLPSQGIVRVVPLQAGVIGERRVQEGQSVSAGDVLFVLVSERASATGSGAESTISALMQSRRASIQAELAQQRQQSAQRIDALSRRIADLSAEVHRVQDQRILQVRRISLAEASVARNKELQASNFISAAALQDRMAELLDQQQRLGDLDRAAAATARDLSSAQADLRDLTLQAERDREVAYRNVAAIEQDLTENEARRQILVRAPQGGVVTAITAELGQTVAGTQALATILPGGADLSAELYIPSRSAGFIKPGMEVMLRYQAYAYQKFGQHRGHVRDVSSTALRPEELPMPIANANPSEPLYRIRVRLDLQTVQANGVAEPLKSGMAVDASILLERRKLYEWVLEPLYNVTGRV